MDPLSLLLTVLGLLLTIVLSGPAVEYLGSALEKEKGSAIPGLP
jgi:hypothetical protein